MSFESGSASFRMFYVPGGLPKDVVERFAKRALPPLETLAETPLHGWCGGRHLLDRVITQDNATYGGFLRMNLVKASKKVPEALLRAECQVEEEVLLRALESGRLTPANRREVRKSVEDRLLPTMPPTLQGITIVYDSAPAPALLYAGALSNAQVDALTVLFAEATDKSLVPVTVETVAATHDMVTPRAAPKVRDWLPFSFSPDVESELVLAEPGHDFLTYLWFLSEARGGLFTIPEVGVFAVMLEGPLTFEMAGEGSHVTVLRRGEPLLSAEAKAALLAGKKLQRARLTLARGDETWKCTIDASLAVRGLKLPQTDKLDAVSRFQERMAQIDVFRTALLDLVMRFVKDRSSKDWKTTAEEIHAWVKGRKTRS